MTTAVFLLALIRDSVVCLLITRQDYLVGITELRTG